MTEPHTPIERIIWLGLPLNCDPFATAQRIIRKLDAAGYEIVPKERTELADLTGKTAEEIDTIMEEHTAKLMSPHELEERSMGAEALGEPVKVTAVETEAYEGESLVCMRPLVKSGCGKAIRGEPCSAEPCCRDVDTKRLMPDWLYDAEAISIDSTGEVRPVKNAALHPTFCGLDKECTCITPDVCVMRRSVRGEW